MTLQVWKPHKALPLICLQRLAIVQNLHLICFNIVLLPDLYGTPYLAFMVNVGCFLSTVVKIRSSLWKWRILHVLPASTIPFPSLNMTWWNRKWIAYWLVKLHRIMHFQQFNNLACWLFSYTKITQSSQQDFTSPDKKAERNNKSYPTLISCISLRIVSHP